MPTIFLDSSLARCCLLAESLRLKPGLGLRISSSPANVLEHTADPPFDNGKELRLYSGVMGKLMQSSGQMRWIDEFFDKQGPYEIFVLVAKGYQLASCEIMRFHAPPGVVPCVLITDFDGSFF